MRKQPGLRSSIEQIDSPIFPGSGPREMALSILLAAIFPFLGIVILGAVGNFMWEWRFKPWVAVGAAIAAIMLIILGPWRMMRVERDERVERQLLARNLALDDAERSLATEIVEEIAMGREPNAQRIDSVARKIMRRHFMGLPFSREECVKAGVCNYAEWNRVSELMRSRGVKKGNKIVPDAYHKALELWYAGEEKANSFRIVDGELVPKV